MPHDIFISYSRIDIERARPICDGLEAAQFTVWWDQKNIRGDDYACRLTQWIRTSQDVIVLLSRRSVGSIWVKREVLLSDSYKRRIIPVYFDSKRGTRKIS